MFKISVMFSDNSLSELLILFICKVVVWMLFTFCSFKFSVSSNFIVISACSSLSTSFLKSKSGSRIEEGLLSFLLLFFAIDVLELSLGFPSSLYFYNHEY